MTGKIATAVLTIVLVIEVPSVHAQACCSAGTPILGGLELPATDEGAIHFALTYHRNSLRDVYSGSEELDDNLRHRTTHSLLLESSYGVSESITLTALVSYVQQERTVVSSFDGSEEFVRVRGLGDAVILVKYSIIAPNIVSRQNLAVGLGTKIPVGASTVDQNGVLFPADMQPGTGAWDGIVWLYGSHGLGPQIPLNVFAIATYRLTGVNKRYGSENEGYEFGNEFIAEAGGGYRTDSILDMSLVVRYRHTSPDRFAGSDLPNTGGSWLSIVPGLNLKVTNELTIRASGQFPVYRNLTGTQLTTTYTAALTIFYLIDDVL